MSSSNEITGVTQPRGALHGVRVVELAGAFTPYCGKLLRDLGAEVVLVESPCGSAQRREGPFIGDVPDCESSLTFAYCNAGKKSVRLDIATRDGQDAMRRLLAGADIFVESEAPGRLASLGLGYAALSARHPALVMTSVTAFGQEGPYAHFAYADLTLLALGGLLYLGGYPDTPPIRVYGDQAIHAASMYAAVASMAAYYAVVAGGDGDYVDVSAQQCVTLGLESSVPMLELEGTVRKRYAGEQRQAGTGVFPTADGFVYLMAAGIASNRFWNNTVQWLLEEGVAGAQELTEPKWAEQDYLASAQAKQRFGAIFVPFSSARTSESLYQAGQRHRMPICPVCTPAQVLRNRQLLDRGYFARVPHAASGRELVMPGAPYQLTRTPWQLPGSPPRLGEHDDEILGRIDASAAGSGTVTRARVQASAGSRQPLAGIRVADFTWIGAGSYATKMLADLGAEVIKIESSVYPDLLRTSRPFKDGIKGVNRSGYFADRNASKRSITINMKEPRGRDVALALIEKSDLVTNNFAPGVMERWGVGYPQVAKRKPDIVYLAMSMQGATGPEKDYIGYGMTMTALTGLQYLTGLPDRVPAGTGTNYPDHIPNPCHAAFVVLAALAHRRRTGEGQAIDLAQTETTLALLGPVLLDQTVNGRTQMRNGNVHERHAPHGVYPCQGDDRWIAIAVQTDAQWSALVQVLAGPAALAGGRWDAAAARLNDRALLDEALAGLTRAWNADDLMLRLQAHGVPAGTVRDAPGVLYDDAQLRHRRHWLRLEHPEMGATFYNSEPFRFAKSTLGPLCASPLLGEHTMQVCTSLLGMGPAEVTALQAAGVLC